MEETKQHQIYMLFAELSNQFDQDQWNIIKSQRPQTFLERQQIILNRLLRERKLFQKYFQTFYQNHMKLLRWSTLATAIQSQIKRYIFKSLISNGSSILEKKISSSLGNKQRRKIITKELDGQQRIKLMDNDIYSDFFNQMVLKNKKDSIALNCMKEKYAESMDGHDFYIKTFNACNGWKYIFYNYEKHMKGLNEKVKYNSKIRAHQKKSLNPQKKYKSLGLLNYQHPNFTKAQKKAINLTSIVNNLSANTIKNFKQIVKQSATEKIIFRNHQGKPITYHVMKL